MMSSSPLVYLVVESRMKLRGRGRFLWRVKGQRNLFFKKNSHKLDVRNKDSYVRNMDNDVRNTDSDVRSKGNILVHFPDNTV